MVVDLPRYLPLLLLLELWEPMYLLCSQPKGLSRAHWFEIQHIQTSRQPCNTAMRGVNNYTQHCKQINTFLHESFQNVAATCSLHNITCKNGRKNCHESAEPVKMTDCSHTGGAYPNCRYSSDKQYKFFIVACEHPKKEDPPYQLVPVHLDKIV
ncbi:ribonuclease, RNase A family, 6 [Mus musculus]|uniref:Ribonuclease K6 n=3 Tax=Mus musculus TaxID=10090 RepID=RNAS6_MOUSE|nr:RecName: Full=Ribonuclease K6; Short=RNase K6; Flags: Precursor [Mus musculus]AAH94892.1 Ribonuclease, RNase A family, 6 [Mus musculus]AAI32633.1 Ribonuclease, RNase A family, 6 [Mus musculus]AAS48640.1 RNase 6 [Mus musculus]EDL20846.1 ribonuclease, RNase A family, 6 [Mus musculus]CDG32020.1 TPA: ribonuclease A d1 [Mus musculus]